MNRLFVIVLLSTNLGWQRSVDLVSAFSHSPLIHSRLPLSALYDTLNSIEEDGDHLSREELIDEAVLLYSVVSQRARFDDNTQGENDILKLRGDELTELIEDAIFDAKGTKRGGVIEEESSLVQVQKEPETLSEISKALDEQILLGYEATFSEEEIEEWVGEVDALQQKLQIILAALPPGSALPVDTMEASEPTPLDQMYTRLGTMRTLIDPEGRDRLRLPLAQPTTDLKPKPNCSHDSENLIKPVLNSPSRELNIENDKPKIKGAKSNEYPTQEKNTLSKLDIENAFIESINKAVESKSTSTAAVGFEKDSVESKSPQPDTKASTETVIPVTGNTTTTSDGPSGLELENAMIEAMNKAAVDDSPSGLQLENTLIEAMNKAAEDDTEDDLQSRSDLENTVIESMNKVVDDDAKQNELELENALIESMNKAALDDSTSELELEDAMIEAINKTAVDDSPSELELENALIEAMNNAAENKEDNPAAEESNTYTTNNSTATNGLVEHSKTAIKPQDGTDVVSTVVTAAALGAAAVTKFPLVLTGVALGPVIRDSIAYAKSRTKKGFDNKPVAELESKDKQKSAPKPKAWSAFDPKPNKNVASKPTNSDSENKS